MSSAAPEVRRILAERFVLHEQIGEGATGKVFRAFDHKLGCDVALKTLREVGAHELYGLKREFRIVAEVVHPNLVELHNLVADGTGGFFTMELVHGVNLLDHVRWPGFGVGGVGRLIAPSPQEVGRAWRALAQLASGLSALHDAGRLHCDLKPANVMVTLDSRLVVLDFGLAAVLEPRGSAKSRGLAGTIQYMSPEQAWDEELSAASDWYSVGVMLYEALTGCLPFEGPLATNLVRIKQAPPPRPSSLVAGVPPALDDLIVALLAPDPARRAGAAEISAWIAEANVATTRPGSVARASRFVGRRRELDHLRRVVLGAREQRNAAVVRVSGPSGMGKTALVSELRRELEVERRTLVLAGRCHPQESVQYNGVDGAMEGLSQYLASLSDSEAARLLPVHMAALSRLFPVLHAGKAPEPGDPSSEPSIYELRRRAVSALRDLLGNIAAQQPLVVWIDDVQWADGDTTALLEDLLRQTIPGLVVILTLRDGGAASVAGVLRSVTHELELSPLETGDIAMLTEVIAGRQTEHPQLETIVRESGGNPFLVAELSHALALTRSADAPDLTNLLLERMQRLSEPARRLLQIVAVAGRPLPRSLALQAAGIGRDATALVLQLRLDRVLHGRFTSSEVTLEAAHDRIREAIVAALPDDVRRARHLDIASALEHRPDPDPQELLEHLFQAGERHRAATYAIAAAEAAAAALAFNRAAQHYRMAIELDITTLDPGELRRRLADALARSGRTDAAAQAYADAAAHLPAGSEGHAVALRLNAAEQHLRGGQVAEGTAALREVLRATGISYPSATVLAVAEIVGRRLMLAARGVRFREPSRDAPAPALIHRLDALWSAVLGLNMIDILRSAVFQARHASVAFEAGDARHLLRALGTELSYAACEGGAGKRQHAERIRKSAADLAERFGDEEGIAFFQLCCAAGSYYSGRFRDALAHVDRAEVVFRRRHDGTTWELLNCQMYRAWSLAWLGELAELRKIVPALVDEAHAQGSRMNLAALASAHANLAWLAAGRPDQANAWAEAAVAPFPSTGFQSPHYFDLIAQVRIDLYAGRGASASRRMEAAWPRLTAVQFLRMQLFRVELSYLRACAALADGAAVREQSSKALRIARDVAARLEREDHPVARPLGLLVQAGVAASRGDEESAAKQRLAAAALADACGLRAIGAAASWRSTGEHRDYERMLAAGVIDPARFSATLVAGP